MKMHQADLFNFPEERTWVDVEKKISFSVNIRFRNFLDVRFIRRSVPKKTIVAVFASKSILPVLLEVEGKLPNENFAMKKFEELKKL